MKHILLSFFLLATCLGSLGLGQLPTRAAGSTTIHLPAVLSRSGWSAPFGVHTSQIGNDSYLNLSQQLGIDIARYGYLSWRKVQPQPGAPYNWAAIADVENTLRKLRQANIEPMLFIGDSPAWATIPRYSDGQPTSCGAIRDEFHDEYAAFVRAAVTRYSAPEFDVTYYEMGNEVDADPTLVFIDSGYGCWGDIRDPYYGGERYGRMLKAVYPAIKAANPEAQVLFGGLLLSQPNTVQQPGGPYLGKPENFLEGALRAGAGASFDILPFHVYPAYTNRPIDYDTEMRGYWYSLGGNIRGKASFLRGVMARYGVNKRLWINEISLTCPNNAAANKTTYPHCFAPLGPSASFYNAQANFLVRATMRSFDLGIEHVTWYSLEDSWGYSSLLTQPGATPTVTYQAFKHLIDRLGVTHYNDSVNYGPGVEAYAFFNGQQRVQVVFTSSDTASAITLPPGKLIAAYTRDGAPHPVTTTASGTQVTVGFSPIYLIVN
jgi:hypothetical protein